MYMVNLNSFIGRADDFYHFKSEFQILALFTDLRLLTMCELESTYFSKIKRKRKIQCRF